MKWQHPPWEQTDAEPEELDLPDPLLIDGLGMPGQLDDLRLPQRVPSPATPLPGTPAPGTPMQLPAMASAQQEASAPASSGQQEASASAATPTRGARERPQADEGPPPELARIHVESLQETLVVEGGNLHLVPPTAWDGSCTYDACRTEWKPRGFLIDYFADEDSDPDDWPLAPAAALTATRLPDTGIVSRAEKKAAQRELPVSIILQQQPASMELFLAAARKEEQSWALWSPVVPVDDEEAKLIMNNPSLKSRILTARAAFRDKASGSVPADQNGVSTQLSDVKAKCRV
eukprot:1811100-Amphidinium_carterae.1